MAVRAGTGNYNASTDYTILTANGGRTGRFNKVTSDMAFLTPKLSYDANHVYLNLARNNIQFADLANTANQRQIANRALAGRTAGDTLYDAIAQLNTSQARQAYDDLSGEIHSSLQANILNDSQGLSHLMHPHTSKRDGALWGQLIRQSGTWQDDDNAHKLTRTRTGAIFGYDLPISGDWRWGVAAGLGRNQYEVETTHATANATQVFMGAYTGRDWQQGDNTLTLRLNSSYSLSDIDVTRKVNIGQSLNHTLNSDYQIHSLQLGGKLGYSLPLASMTLNPYTGLNLVGSQRSKLEENGGTTALSSDKHISNNAFVSLGTCLDKHFSNLHLYADIGARHAIQTNHAESTYRLADGAGNEFTVRGNSSGQTVGIIHAGVDYSLTPNAKLTLNSNATLGNGINDYGIQAGVKWGF